MRSALHQHRILALCVPSQYAVETLENRRLLSGTDWTMGGVGDFNGDGHVDAIWRNNITGENVLHLMHNTALAAAIPIQPRTDTNWGIRTAGDMDRDGIADILWQNTSTGAPDIWLMDGDTLDLKEHIPVVNKGTGQPVTSVGSGWVLEGVGDFVDKAVTDDDNCLDLVWRNYTTGETLLWRMAGPKGNQVYPFTDEYFYTSSGTIATAADTNWILEGIGDFDSNGKPDLVWRHQATWDMVVWIMDAMPGRGNFQTGDFAVLPKANIVAEVGGIAPVDGDSYTDILFHNTSTNHNFYYSFVPTPGQQYNATYKNGDYLPETPTSLDPEEILFAPGASAELMNEIISTREDGTAFRFMPGIYSLTEKLELRGGESKGMTYVGVIGSGGEQPILRRDLSQGADWTLSIVNQSKIHLEGIIVEDAGMVIWGTGHTDGLANMCYDITVRNMTFRNIDSTQAALRIDGLHTGAIEWNTFENLGQAPQTYVEGINGGRLESVRIDSNLFDLVDEPIHLVQDAPDVPLVWAGGTSLAYNGQFVQIRYNVAKRGVRAGIELQGDGWKDLDIIGNHISQWQQIAYNGDPDDEDAMREALGFQHAFSISIPGSTGVRIIGNYNGDGGGLTNGYGAGMGYMEVNANDVLIEDNVFNNTSGNIGSTDLYTSNVTVRGNIFRRPAPTAPTDYSTAAWIIPGDITDDQDVVIKSLADRWNEWTFIDNLYDQPFTVVPPPSAGAFAQMQ